MYIGSTSSIVATDQDARPDAASYQRMDLSIDVCLQSFVHQVLANLKRVMVNSYYGHAVPLVSIPSDLGTRVDTLDGSGHIRFGTGTSDVNRINYLPVEELIYAPALPTEYMVIDY